ncbi:NAD(P)-dependent oxidoreductase [Diaminobutyricibacter tongyongensis]|uniref:NAD(P)-dependent oxidoreductase n=1 Tax=Leifsonia tongyongensis TaxID=1268043 RepID=A0A6L9XYA6_9MICO|nr:NAD(P)-binding domain-containing protein [Diaminobutyricibacter tongyongensis]NEN06004.1 NAD(P)-dependent oxidoreductase [Diaminobutyricibacter tongyongensis]
MKISFIGLGRMGRELVVHLIDAGHEVTVWNRSAPAAEDAGARGATVAGSAAEAVAGAEVVVSALFGPEAVREVILDAGLPFAPSALWIDVTTVAPADAASFAAWAADAEVRYVHSPVIGSLAPARAGRLAVLVGGAPDAAKEAAGIVAVWADPDKLRIVDTAPKAATGKLIANLALAVSMEGVVEALRLGHSNDLSTDDVLSALSLTTLAPLAASKGDIIRDRSFDDTQFSIDLLLKDTRLMIASSRVPLPAVSTVHEALEDASRDGRGEKDIAALAEPDA